MIYYFVLIEIAIKSNLNSWINRECCIPKTAKEATVKQYILPRILQYSLFV